MKISNSKKHRLNKTAVIIATILMLLSTGLTIAYFNNALPIKPSDTIETGTSLEDVNFDNPSEEQVTDGTTTKGKNLDETEVKPDTSTDSSTGKTTISISIPSINQTNDAVRITSLIQTVTTDGTCTLTLSANGREVVKTAPVQALSNSSTCQGFTVNTSDLNPGTWKVNLVFENSTQKATTQQTFEVQ